MSSHHIVRDNQEPALFIDAPIYNFEWIGQLLEWSPILIVNANYLDWIIMHDLKPDVILFDFELSANLISKYKADWFPLEVIEGEITKSLIDVLESKNQKYLNWYCNEEKLPKTTDFILQNKFNFNVVTQHKRCVPVYTEKFSKWLNEGNYQILNTDNALVFYDEQPIDKIIEISESKTVTLTLTSNKPYFFCEDLS